MKTFVAAFGVVGFALAVGGVAGAQSAASATEAAMVKTVDAATPGAVELLERIVDINSGTMNLAGVVRVKDVIAPQLEALGFTVRWNPMNQVGRAGDLVAEHPCLLGAGKCGQRLLLIGHMDTVFDASSPFQKYEVVPGTNGRVATGPGTCDMKGGLVVMLDSLRAMQAAGVLKNTEITIVLSGDEEDAGRPIAISRKDMIDAAKHSDVALEFENAFRDGGVDGVDAVRIGRRSSNTWRLETSGKSGHSSLVFGDKLGYGAIYELARILDAFRTQLQEPGLTYSVGLVLGGGTADLDKEKTGGTASGKANIVPQTAVAVGDFRTVNEDQTARVKAKMEAIVGQHLALTDAKISFDEPYPSMAVTPGSQALLAKLQLVNETLGYGPEEVTDPAAGGAGDISFVAPYVPGLVGVGAMGTGAHAVGEVVYLDSIPKQAKRMALLMYRLSREK
ncbi:MAG TPA: M20/M25/M40 family metallo-hydrolase [Acidobacteriaceae bacterium]|nr:M20/M25/M40 family metallo-hydrolase [Acidobacteriaceae bacterium]